MNNLLKKSLRSAPIIQYGGYDYLVHPITDGIPSIQSDLLREVVSELKIAIKPYLPFDKLVTVESMGIPIASILCCEIGIPLTIIRKRPYGLPGEVRVIQKTGYSKANLFINGIKKDDTILLIDDVLSTGNTMLGLIQALHSINVKIKGLFVVINKGDEEKNIFLKTGVPVHSIININIKDKQIVFP
jgi:adenine phosphoribosyltransferase